MGTVTTPPPGPPPAPAPAPVPAPQPPRPPAPNLKFTAEKKAIFLRELLGCGSVIKASRIAGVDRDTVYDHAKRDPVFKAQFEEVRDERNEMLEEEAYRRAYHGVKRPVVQGGKVVTAKGEDGKERPVVITEFSDDLLKFIMSSTMPNKYGSKLKIDAQVRQTGVLIVASAADARAVEQELAALEKARRGGSVIDADYQLETADVQPEEMIINEIDEAPGQV